MKQYGKTLVNFLPEQTTALLKKLCTEGGFLSPSAWPAPLASLAFCAHF